MKIHDFHHVPDFLDFSHIHTAYTIGDDFAIYSFEETGDEAHVSINAYRHHYYEMTLDINEGCSFQIDHFKFPLDKSRLTIIGPQRLQSNFAHPELSKESQGFTVFFSEDYLQQHLNHASFFNDFRFLRRDHSPGVSLSDQRLTELETLFGSIRYEIQQYGRDSKETIRSYLNIIFQKAKQDYLHYKGEQISSKTHEIVSNFEFLLHHQNREFATVKEFAQALNVTPKYLSEIVKVHTGKTALEMILDLKMTSAKALLSQTRLSIKEIAYELGFEEPNYFSTFFKHREGRSPVQFRSI